MVEKQLERKRRLRSRTPSEMKILVNERTSILRANDDSRRTLRDEQEQSTRRKFRRARIGNLTNLRRNKSGKNRQAGPSFRTTTARFTVRSIILPYPPEWRQNESN